MEAEEDTTMIPAQMMYQYFKVKSNRTNMIKKLQNPKRSVVGDPEVEQFQIGFLTHWNNLEEFEPVLEDLKEFPKEQWDEKKKEMKRKFCEWVSEPEGLSEGLMFVERKKQQIRTQIQGLSPFKAVKKILASDSDKVGRNDPCPCGSGLKYKKCCSEQQ